MAVERGGIDVSAIRADPLLASMYSAAREALGLIAAAVPAMEFFTGAQDRGLAVGIVHTPEGVMSDPHIRERGAYSELFPEALDFLTYAATPSQARRRMEISCDVIGAGSSRRNCAVMIT
jgi:crotonobetainyl-CoA:carnitine CoA-transferase CaiB-like acyl-CoA transferase